MASTFESIGVAILYHARYSKRNDRHSDCPDGIAAAWVASKVYPSARLIPFDYNQWKAGSLPDLDGVNHLIIVDFSFPRHVLQDWAKGGITVELLDHHKGGLKDLGLDLEQLSQRIFIPGSKNSERNLSIVFENQESGATLAWKHFFGHQPMPAFLSYVKDRDLWLKSLPSTDEVYEAMANARFLISKEAESSGVSRYKALFAYFDQLAILSQEDLIEKNIKLGSELLNEKQLKIQQIAVRSVFKRHQGVLAITIELYSHEARFLSDLGNYLCILHEGLGVKFAALQTSQGHWELRSLKGFDCLAIAQQYGGGGHREACGCQTEIEWDKPSAFKIGDMVEILDEETTPDPFIGKVGTVEGFDDSKPPRCLIQFIGEEYKEGQGDFIVPRALKLFGRQNQLIP